MIHSPRSAVISTTTPAKGARSSVLPSVTPARASAASAWWIRAREASHEASAIWRSASAFSRSSVETIFSSASRAIRVASHAL